jgi:pantothenate kinase
MFQPLDGPSAQTKITSVGIATPVEVKVGASALTDRQVITLQPTGNMKVYFSDGSVPSAATVLANGLDHFKNAKETYEAGEKQRVFVLAATGTIDVVIVERA